MPSGDSTILYVYMIYSTPFIGHKNSAALFVPGKSVSLATLRHICPELCTLFVRRSVSSDSLLSHNKLEIDPHTDRHVHNTATQLTHTQT